MKRQLSYLCLLPLLWLGAGCLPQEYYRESYYQQRSYAQPQGGSHAPSDRYGAGGDQGSYQRQVPIRALRKYRRYVKKCQSYRNKCRYRTRVIRRAIERLRRSMYYQQDVGQFDQARARMQFYYQNMRKYHRCVSVYNNRMRWARSYFYRQYGVDPGYRRATPKRRFAQPPRRYARRFAQPPPGDHRNQRPYHRDNWSSPQVTPRVSPAVPVVPPVEPTPPELRQNPSPDPVKPDPVKPDHGPVEPRLAVPTPRPTPPVQPGQPSMPNTAEVRRWLQYCIAERRKYPMQIRLQYQTQRSIDLNKHKWESRAYDHKDIATIQPLHSSGGRYVVLGADGRYSQAHCEDHSFHVWDAQQHKSLKLRPPVTAFLLQNPHLLPWFQGKKHASVEETLLHYNPSAGQAGLMIKAAFPAMKGRSRYLYLQWDLQGNRITNAWTLGSPGCHSAYRPVGVTPDGQTLYYLMNDIRVQVKCNPVSRSMARANSQRYAHKLMAMDLNNGRRRVVSRFTDSSKRFDTYLPNRDFSKVAAIEYAELDKNRGKVFVIDTRSGRVKQHSAPLTPYGVAFSADQKSLLIYNSKRGQLVRIALASGQRDVHKTHRMGHAMGLSKDGKHVYLVFHGGIEVRDASTLKRIDYLAHRKVMGNIKFIHVDGSKVAGGVVFVKNGEKLYIQRLQLQGKHAKREAIKDLRNQIHGLPQPQAQPKAAPTPAPAPRLRKQPEQPRPVPASPGSQYIEY